MRYSSYQLGYAFYMCSLLPRLTPKRYSYVNNVLLLSDTEDAREWSYPSAQPPYVSILNYMIHKCE